MHGRLAPQELNLKAKFVAIERARSLDVGHSERRVNRLAVDDGPICHAFDSGRLRTPSDGATRFSSTRMAMAEIRRHRD
jgi:hypothetical protein